jgi:RimJ/RimL family protein N-acetyltransferase
MAWWPIDEAFGPYRAFSEQLVAAGRLGPRLAWCLFGVRGVEDQIRAGRILVEGTRQKQLLVGAYLNLFHVPFRSYGGTTVSDEGGEGDVRQDNGGREEHRELALADGTCVLVREIQPGDAPALQRLVGRLSEQTIYLRYFGPMRKLSDKQARYFAEVDSQDRYALVALDPENEEEIVAVVRYDREKGTDRAEYAALVEDRLQGRGLGIALTRSLIEAARERGIRDFEALVLSENRGMLHLLRSLGLPESTHREDDGIKRVSVDLFPEQRFAENQRDG